jgi:hypothetical protein
VDATSFCITPYEIHNRSNVAHGRNRGRRLAGVEQVCLDQLHPFETLESLALTLDDPGCANGIAARHELLHDGRPECSGPSRHQHFRCHAGNLTVRSQVYLRAS